MHSNTEATGTHMAVVVAMVTRMVASVMDIRMAVAVIITTTTRIPCCPIITITGIHMAVATITTGTATTTARR
uniref:Uncharacterized protein n=1 Tax=Anopheles braziliensis TaxID=58242 RepID=A0A2M3ZLW0_9DIPT